MRSQFTITSILLIVVIALLGLLVSSSWFWAFAVVGPFILIGFIDMFQKKSPIFRNFPVVGHFRAIAEWMRPKVQQYFVESDTNGRPFSRIERTMVYERSAKKSGTVPFGTQFNVYDESYEWMNHSINALDAKNLDHDPRVVVGGKDCKQPYSASIYNVSAMSFGSLSKNAVKALNGGAAIGGFAHNTGEGGISPYHLELGGDLIYQIGTGYFGSRAADGNFSDELFAKRANQPSVKMIEIKLSQGAKPGHGGILPAKKVTEEIAEIRNIEMGKDVLSPPYHKAFNTPIGLLKFVKRCRDLSNGKPIGFKLCIGQKSEFVAICKAMIETGIKPDFIAIDGGEGGTGAAPVEFSNYVGMPYREGLAFAYNCLIGFGIKKEIKLFASGRIVSGFDIFRSISLGADACYSARAMMMALGCIQALECNKNTCPVGVATQDPQLAKGLVVSDKKHKVANFHKETVHAFVELMAAAGLDDPDQINRNHVTMRVNQYHTRTYSEAFNYIPEGSLLGSESIPRKWQAIVANADSSSFEPRFDEVYIEED